MDVKLAVLADFASITQEGKLNILGIFDEITSKQFPVSLPIFYIVVSFEAGPAEFESEKRVQIVLANADGQRMMELEQTVKVPQAKRPGTRSTMNQIGGIVQLPFPEPGDYQFAILVNGQEAKTIGVRLIQSQ